jgi:hypothetical protein
MAVDLPKQRLEGPLIGGGRSRLQPVYVEDVADAVTRMLADSGTAGRTYELAGPQIYTLLELIRFALRLMGRRRPLLPIPFAVAEIQARLFEFLPSPPLTTSQVDLLKADNVASGTLPGFRELDIQPKMVEEIVPTYVGAAPRRDLPHRWRGLTPARSRSDGRRVTFFAEHRAGIRAREFGSVWVPGPWPNRRYWSLLPALTSLALMTRARRSMSVSRSRSESGAMTLSMPARMAGRSR